jgi:ABC-type bacteriocin/lantibiotic exporter with double-glycine peptidase domain
VSTPLPPAAIRLYSKRGNADCAIAALASYLRVDYEEVLIAAAKARGNVWKKGLNCPQMINIGKRLGFALHWRKITADTLDEATGVLAVRHYDAPQTEHALLIVEGVVYESEDHPVTRWDVDAYLRTRNAYPSQLLEIVE